MLPFLATEFHSVAGQNKFPRTGTNRPNMPRNGKLVTVLVTDSISVAKQRRHTLVWLEICKLKEMIILHISVNK